MRLGLFSDPLSSSAVRDVSSELPLALLIRQITSRNEVHYFSDTPLVNSMESVCAHVSSREGW
ncbi:hypothetical protein [Rubritalea tangerina]|uniref:hypothetical protein n=1 Tax=Rubritalea tangerina TaxID=430798 RepID=UPI00361F7B60